MRIDRTYVILGIDISTKLNEKSDQVNHSVARCDMESSDSILQR